ncbi:serine/threonine-protein kinase [Streptomyces sp. NPDC005962]|uniref:serine/threonine-protein kinase n=1 Tax=Streptomyces sp. NPDC005962 TaxID=3154466 RepID=UPI0033C5E1C3
MLGRGGMGVVWRATDELIGRPVAVKELRAPQGLSEQERAVFGERALREARTSGGVSHPAVVAIHDLVPATAEDEAVYIVMELVDAPSLADILERDGALSEERVAGIGARVLDALDVAHSTGLVHRDVKPSNIMALPGDEVKLVDFGIAHALDDTRLTRHGVAGSTGYMAPELFEGEYPSPATDLWSLGATLFHAVEGNGPFDRSSTAATIHAILYDDPPSLDGDSAFSEAIAGLLTRDTAQRMSSQQARDLLNRAATTPTAGVAPPSPAAAAPPPPDAERLKDTWEDHPTTIKSTTPPPRKAGARSRARTGKSYVVHESQPIKRRIRVTFFTLYFPGLLAIPLLLGPSWSWCGFVLFPFILIESQRMFPPWWKRVTITSEGITVSKGESSRAPGYAPSSGRCTVTWEHVDAVAIEETARAGNGSGHGVRTRVSLRMAATTPAAIWGQPPFRGFVTIWKRKASAINWTLGEIDAPMGAVRAAFRAAAPSRVRVASSVEE